MTRTRRRTGNSRPVGAQNGAALIIVLFIVATLSVIAIGLTDQTVVAAARGRNEVARTQMFWRMHAAENLATALLSQALEAKSTMSLDDIWAAQSFDLTVLAENEGETGSIQFADATGCFNLNGLDTARAQQSETGGANTRLDEEEERAPTGGGSGGTTLSPAERMLEEYVAVLSSIGISESDARQLGIRVRDWIDADQTPGPGGAEDETYQRLPVPYRPGNTLLADVTELRAMLGVDPTFLAAIAPLVCAHPTPEPSRVNINMLTPLDAPVLVGIFEGAISLSDAEALIERRPLGGYDSVADVLRSPILAGGIFDRARASNRLDVRSQFLKARLNLEFGKTILEVTMLFEVQSRNRLALISRRIGSDR
ncbi:MAG: type II secretion system minor pseudopilin GspK [Pseudomonadota bacterium]